MSKIQYPNTDGIGAFGFHLGRFKWYRKWRGGYWWYSDLTGDWWRHKEHKAPKETIEDYRDEN